MKKTLVLNQKDLDTLREASRILGALEDVGFPNFFTKEGLFYLSIKVSYGQTKETYSYDIPSSANFSACDMMALSYEEE